MGGGRGGAAKTGDGLGGAAKTPTPLSGHAARGEALAAAVVTASVGSGPLAGLVPSMTSSRPRALPRAPRDEKTRRRRCGDGRRGTGRRRTATGGMGLRRVGASAQGASDATPSSSASHNTFFNFFSCSFFFFYYYYFFFCYFFF